MRRLLPGIAIVAALMRAPAADRTLCAQAPAPSGALPQADAREPAAEPWLASLESWVRAVDEHKPGTADEAAKRIARWNESDLVRVRTDVLALANLQARALRRGARFSQIRYKTSTLTTARARQVLGLTEQEAAGGDVNRILRRAVILYTDIAMLVIPFTPDRTGCSSTMTILTRDGQLIGSGCVVLHWGQARALLDAIRPDPADDPFVRLWYRATIAYMVDLLDYANAGLQVDDAPKFLRDDPLFLFEAGFYHEALAAPWIQHAAVESRSNLGGVGPRLRDAEELFRRAVALSPGLTEARLHHGRVLGDLGRHAEAADELRRVAAEASGDPDRRLLFYAELFLGREEQALGNRAAARDHYGRAKELFPAAQSPRLALAHLARESGDRSGAQDALAQMLSLPAGQLARADPWWVYRRSHLESVNALIAGLYRPFLPGGAP